MCSDKNYLLHLCQCFSIGNFFYKIQDNFPTQDFINKMTVLDNKSKEANSEDAKREHDKKKKKKNSESSKGTDKVKSKKQASKEKTNKKDEAELKNSDTELMSTYFEKQGINKNDNDEECSEKNEDADKMWEIEKLCEVKKENNRWMIKLKYVDDEKFYWQPFKDLSDGCSK